MVSHNKALTICVGLFALMLLGVWFFTPFSRDVEPRVDETVQNIEKVFCPDSKLDTMQLQPIDDTVMRSNIYCEDGRSYSMYRKDLQEILITQDLLEKEVKKK